MPDATCITCALAQVRGLAQHLHTACDATEMERQRMWLDDLTKCPCTREVLNEVHMRAAQIIHQASHRTMPPTDVVNWAVTANDVYRWMMPQVR